MQRKQNKDAQVAQRGMIFKSPLEGLDSKRSNEQSSQNSQVSERNFDENSQQEDQGQVIVTGENNIPYQMDTEEPTMLEMEDHMNERKKLLCEKRSYTASAGVSHQIYEQENQEQAIPQP